MALARATAGTTCNPPLPRYRILQASPVDYKRRPIYRLFSSGKQRAFQCLVYLHHHEGTLARIRTEYVIPLQDQIAGRIEQLEGEKAKATITSYSIPYRIRFSDCLTTARS